MLKITNPKMLDIEMVVARYKEDIGWLEDIKHRKTIYNKGPDTIQNAIQLKNTGRESHTYLHHIVENYDNLADIAIFTQAHPFDHYGDFISVANLSSIQKMAKARNMPHNEDFCPMTYVWHYDISQKVDVEWALQHITPHALIAMEVMFPRYKPLKKYICVLGAIFAVSKKAILSFEKRKYQELLKLHDQFWSMPWAMEILWGHMFYGPEQPKEKW